MTSLDLEALLYSRQLRLQDEAEQQRICEGCDGGGALCPHCGRRALARLPEESLRYQCHKCWSGCEWRYDRDETRLRLMKAVVPDTAFRNGSRLVEVR